MPDEPNKNYEQIQRDLLRTAIKQPLLDLIRNPANQERKIPVFIEVNGEYYAGKQESVRQARALIKEVAGLDIESIGSEQNPYYRTTLTPPQILEIVDRDDSRAADLH